MYKADGLLTDDEIRDQVHMQLSSVLNQDDDSNNRKVMDVIADIITQKQDDMLALSDMLNIKNAKGDILNLFAADWDVDRIDDDDDFLRFQVTIKMLKSRLGDSMNDLKLLISLSLGIKPSVFDVKPGDEIESMRIIGIPWDFDTTKNAQRKKKLFEQTIQEVISVEWDLQEVQYSTYTAVAIFVAIVTQRRQVKNSDLMHSRVNHVSKRLYAGAVTQNWRQTEADVMTSRTNHIEKKLYAGIVTQQWRQTYADLLETKGVEA